MSGSGKPLGPVASVLRRLADDAGASVWPDVTFLATVYAWALVGAVCVSGADVSAQVLSILVPVALVMLGVSTPVMAARCALLALGFLARRLGR